MPDHTFNPELANKYGTDVAIFLQNIRFWVKYNKAYDKNFHEGRYWTFNSLAAFCEVHPYWSKRQIERIVSSCKKEGLLLTGCFNQDRRDRTSWYTLSDKALEFLQNVTPEMAECKSPNGDLQITEQGQAYHYSVTPLPDINLSIKEKKIKKEKKSAAELDVLFERFWKAYPKKRDKLRARKAWEKLAPDMELCRVMAAALEQQKLSNDWRKEGGAYIPNPSTWLNNRRWEDEPDETPEAGGYCEEGYDGI